MSLSALGANARDLLIQYRRLLLRLAVICGVLGMGAAIGWLIAKGKVEPMMILAVVVAPIGLLIFYRLGRIEYGILAIPLAAGLINFFTLPTGSESRIVISLLVAVGLWALWILQWLLVDKRIWIKPSPVNAPVFVFALINVIAYLWGNAFRDIVLYIWASFPVVQLAAMAVNILLPLLVVLIANKINELKWLRWLTWIMIGMGAIYIVSYYAYSNILNFILNNGSSGLFATWVVALAFAMALFNKDLPTWQRALLLALVGILIYRFFIQARIWLSGWMPLLIVCAVLTFLRSKKAFIALMLVVVTYVGINFDYFYQEIYVANAEEGGLQRLDLWRMNLEHVANHPLFGMGPAGYAVYNMTYHPEDARSTHNNYFDILAQYGIIGFISFLWLFITFVRVGTWMTRRLSGRRNFEEAFACAVLAGCISAMVAMMLGDWVLPFAYNSTITGFDHTSYTWIFIGGMMSLYHIVNKHPPGSDTSTTHNQDGSM
jgi:O-antigen ligase